MDAVLGQLVKRGGFVVTAASEPKVPRPQIIRDNEHDIRPVLGRIFSRTNQQDQTQKRLRHQVSPHGSMARSIRDGRHLVPGKSRKAFPGPARTVD